MRKFSNREKARRRWRGMKDRCYEPRHISYPRYGGRGITVRDRWLNSFEDFYTDTGDPPTSNLQIDRPDNDGPYSPDNWRWATIKEQARNRNRNRLITYNETTLCLSEWGERTGIPWSVIQGRLDKNWDIAKALTVPVAYRSPKQLPVTWNGVTKSVREWSKDLGSRTGLNQRLRSGWSLERAMTQPFRVSRRKVL